MTRDSSLPTSPHCNIHLPGYMHLVTLPIHFSTPPGCYSKESAGINDKNFVEYCMRYGGKAVDATDQSVNVYIYISRIGISFPVVVPFEVGCRGQFRIATMSVTAVCCAAPEERRGRGRGRGEERGAVVY